jgi:hypothetical protein
MVLAGWVLLSVSGCGESGALVAGPVVGSAVDLNNAFTPPRTPGVPDIPEVEGDPSAVQVRAANLRGTPGGCEVDVTFRNVSSTRISAGFRYDILDASGHAVASRSTAVRQAAPGETRTVSSEGTQAGPSGVPRPPGGQPRLAEVSVFNL